MRTRSFRFKRWDAFLSPAYFTAALYVNGSLLKIGYLGFAIVFRICDYSIRRCGHTHKRTTYIISLVEQKPVTHFAGPGASANCFCQQLDKNDLTNLYHLFISQAKLPLRKSLMRHPRLSLSANVFICSQLTFIWISLRRSETEHQGIQLSTRDHKSVHTRNTVDTTLISASASSGICTKPIPLSSMFIPSSGEHQFPWTIQLRYPPSLVWRPPIACVGNFLENARVVYRNNTLHGLSNL